MDAEKNIKIRIGILMMLIVLFFEIPVGFGQSCDYQGEEIPDNYVDEDCNGWIEMSDYDVRSTHPRLFMNDDNIALIRQRAQDSETYAVIKEFCDEHMGETKSTFMSFWDRRTIRYAMIYALGEIPGYDYDDADDDSDSLYSIHDYGMQAKKIVMMLVRGDGASDDMYYQTDVNSIALAYDWTYDLYTDSEKQEIMDYFISELGTPSILQKAQGYRYGGGLPDGLLPGLAVFGDGLDDQKAKSYVDIIFDWEDELKALEHMSGGDGGHGDALGYFNAYLDGQNYAVAHGFRALRTATGIDMMKDSSYILNAPFIHYYGNKPDHKIFRFGDVSPGSFMYSKHLFLNDDAYIQYRIIADEYMNLGDSDSAGFVTWVIEDFFDTKRADSTFDIVAYTHDITPKSPDDIRLPLSKAFGWNESSNTISKFEGNKAGIGWVFMRSAWEDPDATYALFKAEPYFYHGHQHADTLAFTIGKGEDLALASAGMYFYWYEGCAIDECDRPGFPHHWYYFHRAVSTNNLLIYNPDEEFYQSDYSGPHNFGNDGGQRFDFPSTVRYGHECLKPGGYCDLGGLTRYEDTEDYTFATADATIAYNSDLYTEGNNIAKVSKVVRNFVYLKSDDGEHDYFVIFDQVNSKNPDFKKTWLLHTIGKPEFDGTYSFDYGTESGGIAVSHNSHMMSVPGKKYNLYSRTLLPKNPVIRRLGGSVETVLTQPIDDSEQDVDIHVQSAEDFPDKPSVVIGTEAFHCMSRNTDTLFGCIRGNHYSKLNTAQNHAIGDTVTQTYRWMVDDVDYPTLYGTPVSHFPDDEDSYGRWRIEVSPSVARENDVFLNVLVPAASPPEIKLIDEGTAVGAQVGDKVMIFGKEGKLDSVGYEVDSQGHLTHIIADLEPYTTYSVTIDGQTEDVVSSASGILTFTDSATGARTVSIEGGQPLPKCSDGTVYGSCSADIPYMCNAGALEENCQKCGCQRFFHCSASGECIRQCGPADTSQPFGQITPTEMFSFMMRWMQGLSSTEDVLKAMTYWKNGCS